jgi:hypothetical protein
MVSKCIPETIFSSEKRSSQDSNLLTFLISYLILGIGYHAVTREADVRHRHTVNVNDREPANIDAEQPVVCC